MLDKSVVVSATQIIGNLTPIKSRNSDILLAGLSITKQSGKCAVFLKHLKNMIARQNTCNLRNTKLNSASSFMCLFLYSDTISSDLCLRT